MLIQSGSETLVLKVSDYTTVLSTANSYTMFFSEEDKFSSGTVVQTRPSFSPQKNIPIPTPISLSSTFQFTNEI